MFKNIMVDSGAHSVSTKGIQIDIDEYISFIENENIYLCVNLDVIGDGKKSLENWEYMKRISIPVYHVGEDISYLENYIDNAEYIGLGDITGQRPNWPLFLDMLFSKYPYRKYHMFGVQSQKILGNYPIYSCDGTAWMNGIRYGWVMTEEYGNFFLNKGGEDSTEIKQYLFEKYGLANLENYKSKKEYGVEITKINLQEIYNMLVKNHNPITDKPTNRSLF